MTDRETLSSIHARLGEVCGSTKAVQADVSLIRAELQTQGKTLASLQPVCVEHRKRISSIEKAVKANSSTVTQAKASYATLVAAGAAILAALTAFLAIAKAV